MLMLNPTRPPAMPARKPLMPKAIWITRALLMPSSWAVTGSSETACSALPLRLPFIQIERAASSRPEMASSITCTVRTLAPAMLSAAGREPRVPTGIE